MRQVSIYRVGERIHIKVGERALPVTMDELLEIYRTLKRLDHQSGHKDRKEQAEAVQ
jgi:hypothetical protein